MLQTQFKIIFFRSNNNDNLSLAIAECLNQLNNHLLSNVDIKIFKSTLYFQSEIDFNHDILTIKSILEANSPNSSSPVSIVNQPPLGGGIACLEIWAVINNGIDFTIQHKNKNENRYTLLEIGNSSCLRITVCSHDRKTFEENVKKVFEDLDIILKDEGYDYSDIIRQWNYINDIVVKKTNKTDNRQNYQIFNEYRASHYNGSDFRNGYPAATGIGMSKGGIVIEVIAQKGKNSRVVPLQNPKQLDAHHYSEKVLKGTPRKNGLSRPMFERGKYFDASGLNLLFVSGTASIVGEDTIYTGDVKQQTLTTIDNINSLVSDTNLRNYCIEKQERLQMLNYVVYIKNTKDFEEVQLICKQHFGDAPSVFLLADICRDELLVEIEANYHLKN